MDQQKKTIFLKAFASQLDGLDRHNARGCIGCVKCAAMCPYASVDEEGTYTPLRRGDMARTLLQEEATVSQTLERLGMRRSRLTEDLITEMNQLAWRCTMCGSCRLACPRDVPTNHFTRAFRAASIASGTAPEFVDTVLKNARNYHHTFGANWLGSIGRIIQQAREQLGIEVPIDREGATYLWVCSAIALTNTPKDVVKGVQLFHEAQLDLTVSSNISETGTEVHTTATDSVQSRAYVDRIIAEMHRLRVKTLLVGECGCDVRTFLVDYADVFKQNGLQAVFIDDVFLDAIEHGALRPKPLQIPMTFHDPCWLRKKTGYGSSSREILSHCIDPHFFIDLVPNGIENLCCGGGGGMRRAFPPNMKGENVRRAQARRKADQIQHAGVNTLITPCTTCRLSIGDIVSWYDICSGGQPMRVRLLIELLYASVFGTSLED